jgi:hypothetical protein
MQMSGQFHAPAALAPEKEATVLFLVEPHSQGRACRENKKFALANNRTTVSWSFSSRVVTKLGRVVPAPGFTSRTYNN